MEEAAHIMPTVFLSAKYREAVIAWPAFHRVGWGWVPGRAPWDLGSQCGAPAGFFMSTSPLLYQHNSTNAPSTSSFIFYRRYMNLATDSVVKYSTQTNIEHPVTALW